ncbi:MAG TPA: glucoamylase family protein [Bryobacteraceae bacterium]|nr:glucoamylase family protein [Bryobacteraceae bacterium]
MAGQGLASADDELLDDLSRRCFRYFWEQSDPHTGIARDRARADGRLHPPEGRYAGSTGATGFALTALCIGAERGWISRRAARNRARAALDSYAVGPTTNVHGWFYHFVDIRSGARYRTSEVSTSDSTWLVAGALTARQYFHEDAHIARSAAAIYERVDYRWMLNQHPFFLAHGWTPESGFLPYRYDKYCQLACMYLLGIGSPTHGLDPESWYIWGREPFHYGSFDGVFDYYGRTLLWTYQYPFSWWDFRNRRESRGLRIDWFENSKTATRAHRAFCIDLARRFPAYSADIWGITSSDGPGGYQTWGGPPPTGPLDGSVVPCAAAGSLMFTPEICLPALYAMKTVFGSRIYRRYGFVDAFNPNTGWQADDVIGIDVGITLLSAENLRTGNVWKWFMGNPEAPRAFALAGIRAV